MKPPELSEQITPDIERCAVRGEAPESSGRWLIVAFEIVLWSFGALVLWTAYLLALRSVHHFGEIASVLSPAAVTQKEFSAQSASGPRRLKRRLESGSNLPHRLPNSPPSPSSQDGLEKF